ILSGRSGLPEDWTRPIGDIVIPGYGMRDLDTPMTLTEVAERTVSAGQQVVAMRCPDVEIADAPPVAAFRSLELLPDPTPSPDAVPPAESTSPVLPDAAPGA